MDFDKTNDLEFALIQVEGVLKTAFNCVKEVSKKYPDRKISLALTSVEESALWIKSRILEEQQNLENSKE